MQLQAKAAAAPLYVMLSWQPAARPVATGTLRVYPSWHASFECKPSTPLHASVPFESA
jgi:hypothetical protein